MKSLYDNYFRNNFLIWKRDSMQGDNQNPIKQQVDTSEESHIPRSNPELKNINEALRTSEDRFLSILNQSGTGIVECDIGGNFTYANRRFAHIAGYSPEELYRMKMQDILYAGDQDEYQTKLQRLLVTGNGFETDIRCTGAGGQLTWIHLNVTALYDLHGKPASYIAMVRMIDKQQVPLKEWKEERNLNILDSITDGFFAVNQHWQITYINKVAEQLNNRSPGELIGKVLWDEFPTLEASEYGKMYRKVANEGVASTVIARASRDQQWYEAHAFPAKDGIVAYFKNVTKRIVAEEALRKSEENMRTLFNTIDEGFCIIEMMFDTGNQPYDYRFVEYNRLFEEMTGLYGAMGKTARELVPNLEPYWFETYGRVVLTGEPVRFENGSESMNRWFSVYASRIGDEGSRQVALVFANITQRKLIEREQERFLALGSDLLVITGNDYRFIWVSSAWERVLGYSLEELTSVGWKHFVHPDDLDASLSMAEQNFQGEECFAWENRFRHRDGSYRWFSWNAKPYLTEGVLYAVATDITDRKEAEEALRTSEEKYSAIIHQATAGVAERDLSGKHLFVNKKFCEITGFSEEELYQLHFSDYIHPDDLDRYQQLFLHTVTTGQPFISEKRIICKDKTEAWITETISGICDAHATPQSIVSVCIDITDRKTIEKQKDEFIGVASHELKTPVTSVKAFAQVLKFRFAQAGDHQSAEMLQKMENQINRLNVLVQDLLDVTRLEGNRMEFRREVFNFRSMVLNTVEEVQRTLTSHIIVCGNIPEVDIYADLERTAQVLVNFFTNAAKYSPKARQIIVSAFVENDSVTCSVEDYGIGIPVESHQYIFDRFYRVTDHSRNTYPGLGLGLYISSEIIRRQDGDIWFKSSVNQGSTFSFRLPLYHQS